MIRKRQKLDIQTLAEMLKGRANLVSLCLSHSWGGMEHVAVNDALDLARLGIQVKVLCLEGSPIHEYLSKFSELEVLPIEFKPRDWFDFKLRSELRRLVLEGVNLIHTQQSRYLGSIVPWLWRKDDLVILSSLHFLGEIHPNAWNRLLFRRIDAVVAMNQMVAAKATEAYRLKDRQVKVIHLGLDFSVFDPEKTNREQQRQLWGADEDTIVVGMVGRIDPKKGQTTLIRAAAGLKMRISKELKVKFVIVGEETLGTTSAFLEDLKAMVAQYRLENDVVFAGYQENIVEVMDAFDLFVMPSPQESIGLVAVEAMALECPIVIPSGGSATEIVGPEQQFGLLFRRDDAFDLQQKLHDLIRHPETCREMGKKAREHVKVFYDRQIRLRRTLELYERSLRRRGS